MKTASEKKKLASNLFKVEILCLAYFVTKAVIFKTRQKSYRHEKCNM